MSQHFIPNISIDQLLSSSDSDNEERENKNQEEIQESENKEQDSDESELGRVWPQQHKYIVYTNENESDHKNNITFLPNQFKKKSGIPAIHSSANPIKRTQTPPKLEKWLCLKLMHRSQRKGQKLSTFRQKNLVNRGTWRKWINVLKLNTWYKYSAQFKVNSKKFLRLDKYIKQRRHYSKTTKRFYYDPDHSHFGLFCTIEEYAVIHRKHAADSHQWRSARWFSDSIKRLIKNPKLMALLRPFMNRTERKLLHLFLCSKSYVKKIMVC